MNSLSHILAERLRTALRSGATQVHIHVDGLAGDSASLNIFDNGAGLGPPEVVKDLPQSKERLGISSLEGRSFELTSTSRDEPEEEGSWYAEIEPHHLRGVGIPVLDEDPGGTVKPHGTHVCFEADEDIETILHIAKDAASSSPLSVTFDPGEHMDCPFPEGEDGIELPREDFLKGALHSELHEGFCFGVLRTIQTEPARDPDLNWFGERRFLDFPSLLSVDGACWHVRADARSPDVPDPATSLGASHSDLRRIACHVLHRAVAQEEAPRLSHADHQAISENSVLLLTKPLPEHPRELVPWSGLPAESQPPLRAIPLDAVLVDLRLSPPEARALHLALQQDGSLPRFFQPHPLLEGYDWHRRLSRLVSVRTEVLLDGVLRPLDEVQAPEKVRMLRADAILMELRIRDSQERSSRILLKPPVAFLNERKAVFWFRHEADPIPLVKSPLPKSLEPSLLARVLSPRGQAQDKLQLAETLISASRRIQEQDKEPHT